MGALFHQKLSQNQQDLRRHLIRIPMVGKSDSLNLVV